MEELLRKHDRAFKENASAVFAIRDFESIRFPIFQLGYQFITEIFSEYRDRKGYIQIDEGNIMLTGKGLNKAQDSRSYQDTAQTFKSEQKRREEGCKVHCSYNRAVESY